MLWNKMTPSSGSLRAAETSTKEDHRSFQLVHHRTIPLTSKSRALAFSPDGDYLAVGQQDGTIRVFETTTWTSLTTLEAPRSVAKSLAKDKSVTALAWVQANQYRKLSPSITRLQSILHGLARGFATGVVELEFNGVLITHTLFNNGGIEHLYLSDEKLFAASLRDVTYFSLKEQDGGVRLTEKTDFSGPDPRQYSVVDPAVQTYVQNLKVIDGRLRIIYNPGWTWYLDITTNQVEDRQDLLTRVDSAHTRRYKGRDIVAFQQVPVGFGIHDGESLDIVPYPSFPHLGDARSRPVCLTNTADHMICNTPGGNLTVYRTFPLRKAQMLSLASNVEDAIVPSMSLISRHGREMLAVGFQTDNGSSTSGPEKSQLSSSAVSQPRLNGVVPNKSFSLSIFVQNEAESLLSHYPSDQQGGRFSTIMLASLLVLSLVLGILIESTFNLTDYLDEIADVLYLLGGLSDP